MIGLDNISNVPKLIVESISMLFCNGMIESD